MQSFSRGWSFLKQAWSMAFKDKDLLKPSIYALVVGGIISFIGIIPIAIAAVALGGSDFGNIVQTDFGCLRMESFFQFFFQQIVDSASLGFGFLLVHISPNLVAQSVAHSSIYL